MFSGTHKDYQIAEHVQAEMRAEADCCRLAHAQPTESQAMNSDQITRFHFNWAVKGAFAVLLIVALLIAGQQVLAQGPDTRRVDPGYDPGGKPVADYRAGRYYLNHGEYTLAVEKLTQAIAGTPDVLFQMPGYADMYWFLGEAQEGAGLYADALVSYRTFLALVGDQAAPWTFEKVDALSIDVQTMLMADLQT